jgi:hypothetical protein
MGWSPQFTVGGVFVADVEFAHVELGRIHLSHRLKMIRPT